MYVVIPAVLFVAWWYFKDGVDPTAASADAFEPDLVDARITELKTADATLFARAVGNLREFSRLYQTTFLEERDRDVALKMQIARRDALRDLHALRMYLPNDLHAERRAIAGIEDADARMVQAAADAGRRLGVPGIRLGPLDGFGYVDGYGYATRGADDTWP